MPGLALRGVLLPAACLGAALSLLPSTGMSGQEALQAVMTRYGALTENGQKILEFKGRPLDPVIRGNYGLTLGKPTRMGTSDIVLVRDNGGTACPSLYYFVTITASEAKATPSFGTCGSMTRMQRQSDSIAVVMRGYRGPFEPEAERKAAHRQRHTFVFHDGTVREEARAK